MSWAELAAEVEHDDAVGRLRRAADGGTVVLGRALRGGRVEGDLEIGLDLGIVGREHTVAGVGDLAVDGLAAFLPGLSAHRRVRLLVGHVGRLVVGRLAGRRAGLLPGLLVVGCRAAL